jgi:hypothetical protein
MLDIVRAIMFYTAGLFLTGAAFVILFALVAFLAEQPGWLVIVGLVLLLVWADPSGIRAAEGQS